LRIDPSAALPPLFRLARTKSGWRAGAPTKIRLAAAGDFSGWREPNPAGAPARRPKFGWRRRETFPAAAAAEFGATS